MKGSVKISLETKAIKYEFELKRKITIINDESATGKTSFIRLLDVFNEKGKSSGVIIKSNVECYVLRKQSWELTLKNSSNNVFFIDDDSFSINDHRDLPKIMKETDNFYVIILRESFPQLPYSFKEVYKMTGRNRYKRLERKYKDFNDYIKNNNLPMKKLIVEDSGSGFKFFNSITDLEVVSSEGKTNIFKINNLEKDNLIIADGSAFGSEIQDLVDIGVNMYLPESFEFLLLKGLFSNKLKSDFFEKTENYVDSDKYFSWETFFTDTLKEISKDTKLQYNKSVLNKNYLQEENIEKIKEVINKEVLNILENSKIKQDNISFEW